MTLSLYLQCGLMYIIGQALHLFVFKIPAAKARAANGNIEFSFKQYWNSDWHLIIGNQLLGIMILIGLDQLAHFRPAIMEYVKWFFAAVGYMGSSAILSKFSQYEKAIQSVIDIKTNRLNTELGKPAETKTTL